MVKWVTSGPIEENSVYTFTWGLLGKIHWYYYPDVYALSAQLYRLIRNEVTSHATVPDGYPRYSEHQNITIFQVRAPIYTLDRIIYVEDVLEKADLIMRVYTGHSFGVMKEAEFFMPPSGPLAGQSLPLPGAFVASMNSDGAVNDPTGVPGPKSQFAKLWESLGFEEVFAPVKTVVKWGLAGLAGYGLYRVYKVMESFPVKKEG